MFRKAALVAVLTGCLLIAASCSAIPISTLTLGSYTQPTSSTIAIHYTITNIGQADIGSYGFRAKITSSEAGDEYYTYDETYTVPAGVLHMGVATITLNGSRTVTAVAKENHWHHKL